MKLEQSLESSVGVETMSEDDERIGIWGEFNMWTEESENFTNKCISRTGERIDTHARVC